MITAVADPPLPNANWSVRIGVASFAVALFSSAFLLFSLEPMVAKQLLPKLGGTPMVWNTCVVFFQATLLVGYLTAHLASGRSIRHARWLYPALLLGAMAALPLTFTRAPGAEDRPAVWLLLELVRVAGLPVLALSMSAPALQAWFSRTRLPGARDPYFLYAASNTGSLVALLGYPTIIEPQLGLQPQSRWWAAGYIGFAAVVCICLALARRAGLRPLRATSERGRPTTDRWERVRWVALAFIPSSLMLGVTTYISTDVAAVPLIWVLPLALYLATFIVAFGRFSLAATRIAERRLPLLAVAIVVFMSAGAVLPIQFNIPLHLATFTAIAMMCHGRLAAERPPVHRLTEFYFLLSLGGGIGGLFNTLMAPLVFKSVTEYPAILVCACAVPIVGSSSATVKRAIRDVVCAAGIAASVAAALVASGGAAGSRVPVLLLGAIAIGIFSQAQRPLRFSLMLAAMLMASAVIQPGYGTVLHAERTFFGSYHVSAESGRFHALYHGTTLHGLEALESSRAREPLTYYHRDGPFGQAFEGLARLRDGSDVAVVGLGVGSLAAYARDFQQWTFYEIDPAVDRIARDEQYFGFLDACGSHCRVVLGDARLSLAQSDQRFDLIVLDAFSSDSIPMHLVTREAFELYLQRLKPGGILMFHVSNRYLQLGNVLGRLAGDRGLTALEQTQHFDAAAAEDGRRDSDWVIASADRSALVSLAADTRWRRLRPQRETPLWTDDFSNILAVLRFGPFF